MYHNNLHIHFVGCGGIGMSGLALLCKARGHIVSGCDLDTSTNIIKNLRYKGCEVINGHDSSHIGNADIVVYSNAIPGNHPELVAARNQNISTVSRGLFLAELVRQQYSIAVAGIHGKTTTSALIGHLLSDCGVLPTVVTGGMMLNSKTQALAGASQWAVIEAEECDKSLLYLHPTIAVITNIEHEHVNVYPDPESIRDTFKAFLDNIPFYGTAILCNDDQATRTLRRIWHGRSLTYGLDAHSQVRGHIVDLASEHTIFNVTDYQHGLLGSIKLPLIGSHNVQNALAALAVCRYGLGVPFNKLQKSFERFRGVSRRFEQKGSCNNALVVDDYAHHPTEVNAVLLAALNRKAKKIHVVFQHHRYTRTQQLWDGFLKVFCKYAKHISTLHLPPIYAAGEPAIDQIDNITFSQNLSAQCKELKVFCYQNNNEVIDALRTILKPGELVLTLGAGDVTNIASELVL